MKFLSSGKFDYKHSLNFTPGPGHYEPPNTIAKNIERIKAIELRPRRRTSDQGSKRFHGSPKNENELGPGYYLGIVEWKKKDSRREPKPQFHATNANKVLSIPTIPYSTHGMGYVEREDGLLLPMRDSAMKPVHDRGPGAYDVSEDLVRKKIQSFSLSKITAPRFPPSKNESKNNTPFEAGLYSVPKKEFKKNEMLRRRNPRSESRNSAPRPKSDNSPGLSPGHYYNERLASSFIIKTKPQEFQYFDSTAKRFKSQLNLSEDMPGPGSYNLITPEFAKASHIKIEPFDKGERKCKAPKIEEKPGPGAYDAVSNFPEQQNQSFSMEDFRCGFGSSIRRFEGPKIDSQPGPGAYNPYKNNKRCKRKSARSSVKGLFPSSQRSSVSKLSSNEESIRAELDLGGRAKGAIVIMNEDSINKGTSPFQSVTDRFDKENEKRSITPGPGNYYINRGRNLLKPSFSSSNTTFTGTQRDDNNKSSERYKQNLGPGAYKYEVDITRPKKNIAPKIYPPPVPYASLLPK